MITELHNLLAQHLAGKLTDLSVGHQALSDNVGLPRLVIIPTTGTLDPNGEGSAWNPESGRIDDVLATRSLTIDLILQADEIDDLEVLIQDVLRALKGVSKDALRERWEPDEYITEAGVTAVLSVPIDGRVFKRTRTVRLTDFICAKCAPEAPNG